ncbi:MAG: porin family protein [Cytophagales bacterium]|nr:porin family protein [Cytophagales bacterium]
MKKYIYAIALLTATTSTSFAQGLFSISYDIGLPVGNTSDFIGNASFRGFGIEGRGFITDNLSYGGSFSWAVFYEEFPAQEWNIEGETRTAYGRQFRYINSFPLMATMHYYFGAWDATRIYAGGGIGAQKIDQRLDFGMYQINRNKWRFGFAPEAGVLIPVNFNTNINLGVKYQYAVKAGDGHDAVSYLSFKIGLAFM